ncbi:MAG: flagellar export protein FliJ [Proteobacteria bacterium]|nr:flagellar export protein FliJ [Pseudomonadota bacterium]
MAYRFKLETVLGVRRNLEELAQQKLAREIARLEEYRRGLAALKQQRQELIDEFEEKKQRAMPAPLFAFHMEGIFHKEEEIEAGITVVETQQGAVAQAREALVVKMRDKKMMEKARERDYQKYLLAVLKKEQNEADEQMVLRFGRKDNLH